MEQAAFPVSIQPEESNLQTSASNESQVENRPFARSDEAGLQVSIQVDPQVDEESMDSTEELDNPVGGHQTPDRPTSEAGKETGSDQGQPKNSDPPRNKKIPLVAETAKLLRDAEYLVQQQQRDEFLRTKILLRAPVRMTMC